MMILVPQVRGFDVRGSVCSNEVDVQVQESASQFLLVQFGLATFHYDPAKDQFSHRAYNVYVWPR